MSEKEEEEEEAVVVVVGMDRASEELERRSRFLNSLIRHQRSKEEDVPQHHPNPEQDDDIADKLNAAKIDNAGKQKQQLLQRVKVRVRASDMPEELQKRAFRCAHKALALMPKLDSKLLALTLKKEFDSSYGPAWHCIVGTSFGSYVTHSIGGFLYFSIDKVFILLFRTAVEPLEQ